MSDEVAVTVSNGVDELREKRRSVRLREGFDSKNTIVKRRFLTKIGDDEKMRIRVKKGVNLKDVRVRRENLEELGFLIETLTVNWVVEKKTFVDGFDGERGRRRR